ncbi:MAG: SAM-dependent methyltransferase [Pseudonocardia sp.]|nr:SAM-dependent methyltransferase [Pseudonocardia sp.]
MSAATVPVTADDVYQEALIDYETVGAHELGVTYERLMNPGQRADQGSYYTPTELAAFLAQFSLNLGLDQVGPDAAQVLRITALDPACGAGMLLVHAARVLSHAYAARLVGSEPSGDLVLAVMPRVVLECVYGVDSDPVAVDLARLSVSLETAGALAPSMLARHIVCDSVLDGPEHLPPALADRHRTATDAALNKTTEK